MRKKEPRFDIYIYTYIFSCALAYSTSENANPFLISGLFLYPLKMLECFWINNVLNGDQWHDMS